MIVTVHVRIHDRQLGIVIHFIEEIQAIVELMVPNRRRIVLQQMQQFHRWMHFAVLQRLHFRHIVAKRRSLNQIPVVKQKRIRLLSARLLDQTRRLRQPKLIRRTIFEIIVVDEIHMYVRRL